VVQACLEHLVSICENPRIPALNKKMAYAVLHELMEPILRYTLELAEDEFANYIVQFVLRAKFLKLQCKYIIKNSILWVQLGVHAEVQ